MLHFPVEEFIGFRSNWLPLNTMLFISWREKCDSSEFNKRSHDSSWLLIAFFIRNSIKFRFCDDFATWEYILEASIEIQNWCAQMCGTLIFTRFIMNSSGFNFSGKTLSVLSYMLDAICRFQLMLIGLTHESRWSCWNDPLSGIFIRIWCIGNPAIFDAGEWNNRLW